MTIIIRSPAIADLFLVIYNFNITSKIDSSKKIKHYKTKKKQTNYSIISSWSQAPLWQNQRATQTIDEFGQKLSFSIQNLI